MASGLTRALAAKAAGALAWLGYVWLLARLLPSAELGQALFGIGLAGLGGGLAAAGSAQHLLREGSRDAGALAAGLGHGLAAAALGGAVTLAALLTGAAIGLLALSPVAAAASGMAAAAIGLAGIGSAAQRAKGALFRPMLAQGAFRAGLPAAATLALAPGEAVAALVIFALGQWVAAAIILPGLPRPRRARADRAARASRSRLWQAQAGWLIFGHADLLAAGTLLAPAEAAGYLVARRLAGILAHLWDALRQLHAPRLSRALAGAGGVAAAEASARQFLWLGLPAALALAAAGPWLLPAFGMTGGATLAAFWCLTLGQAAPALAGGTGMALNMAGLEAERRRLVWAAVALAPLVLAPAALLGPAWLAAGAAALALGQAAAAARCLRCRRGIRPPALAPFG